MKKCFFFLGFLLSFSLVQGAEHPIDVFFNYTKVKFSEYDFRPIIPVIKREGVVYSIRGESQYCLYHHRDCLEWGKRVAVVLYNSFRQEVLSCEIRYFDEDGNLEERKDCLGST